MDGAGNGRVAKNWGNTSHLSSVPIPGGQFHCLALSQTCPNSMMGVPLGKKTWGLLVRVGPEAEASQVRSGGLGTTQLSILDPSSCLEAQLVMRPDHDRFPSSE